VQYFVYYSLFLISMGNFNIKGIVKFPAVIKSDCVVFAYAFSQGRQTIVECYEENLSCINDVLHSGHDTMSKLHFYNQSYSETLL